MWEKYQEVIAAVDEGIATQLRSMRRQTTLPPLPPKPRVRGRKPHDPKFDVRTALYYVTGVDLTAIEGIDEIHALTLVSELGNDFTKWPTVKHFSSWLGLCPNFQKTGGHVKSSRTRKGKGRAAHALRLAAWSLMRSRSSLGAYLRRQRSRLGAPKAITATAHKLGRILYHLMRYGEAYVKRTEEAYAAQVRERLEKHLHRRARELGYEVKKIAAAAESAAGGDAAVTGGERGSPVAPEEETESRWRSEAGIAPPLRVRAGPISGTTAYFSGTPAPKEVPGAASLASSTLTASAFPVRLAVSAGRPPR